MRRKGRRNSASSESADQLVHREVDSLILLALTLLVGCTAAKEKKLGCEDPPQAPEDLPPFELTVSKSGSQMMGNHVLLNQNNGPLSWATTIDACGNHVWWEPVDNPDNRIYRAKLALDGDSLLIAEKDRDGLVDTAWARRITPEGKELSRTRTIEAHHDLVEIDDGSLAWISHQYADNIWFVGLEEDIVSDVIRTAEEGDETESDERIFSLFDDSDVETWWVCEHMGPSQRVPGFAEWSHSNSLMWEPKDEALYLLIRYWDSVVKLDRKGQVDWYLGGPLNDFEIIADTVLPSHGHMSEVWPGGMLVFDNRNHTPLASRVVEYAIDEEAMTVEEVWSAEEPDGQLVNFLGDARRLPNGNALVSWSTSGRITEYDRKGKIVWEARNENTIGRIQWISDWPG